MQIGGQDINVVDHYKKHLEALIEDLQILLERHKDVQGPVVKRLLRGFMSRFKNPGLFCDQENFDNLIRAAKNIESSQHMALTALLLYNQTEFVYPFVFS